MENALEIRNLTKKYGSNIVLNKISFNVKKGELTGYIGPNGAGKTTTINIIMGIIEKDAGEIYILGNKIEKHDLEIKRLLGYVPETPFIYKALTPLEYFHFIGRMYDIDKKTLDQRIKYYLEFFELEEYKKQLIHTLSKGNLQKTLIISALLHDPIICIFDEPINGLDVNGQFKFKQLLSDLIKQDKTILYSSHIVEIVEKLSKNLIILNKGEIKFQGLMQDLLNKYNSNLERALLKILNDQ